MKIWTCGSSPRSGSRNVWTRIKNVNGASRVSNLWNLFGVIQMISCRDWWPWTKPGYITMTRRQSNNQWSGGIAAHPAQKFPSAKIRRQNSRLDFLGIKMTSSSLIIFQRAQLSTRSITHLCWCNWRTLWRKNAGRGKVTKWVLFLHDNSPAHRTLATQKKLAYLGFQCLGHPPYSPDLDPSHYHLFPGLKQTTELSPFFPTRRSLLPWRPGWTDKFLNFFQWLSKVRATG